MQSPLTAGQLEIWISQVLEPSSPVYNVGDYYEITGAVDAKLLEAAARTAVDEAGSLGARFLVATDGTPYQELGPAEWSFEFLDMSERPDPDAEAVAWMRAEMARPVDLTCGSLLAGALIKVSRDRHFWYRRFHHIITDGHGTAAVARRTAALYHSMHTGSPCEPNPFAPVTAAVEHDRAYRAGRMYAADREFWEQVALDWPATGRLRADAPPAPVTLQYSHHLPRQVVDAVRAQSERLEVSTARFLITAAALYLWQVTGADEVTFGCSATSRPTRLLRNVVAPMANLLPFRVLVEPERSVTDTFRRTDRQIGQALRHHRYRYEEFRRTLAAAPEQHSVGPVVNIVNFDRDLRFGPATGVVRTLVTGPIPDLGLYFDVHSEHAGTSVCVEANPANYTAEEAARHAEGLGGLVRELAGVDPGLPVRALGRPR
ncbi:condensation domain-containing protein [Streptomyces platensis]|uniref:condensation domain-containing protein n=1 Tax=Streptomyces platensis TaxID=58346 RepID=UPI002E14977D|nr:condensation domain-containing protein [Streptomyces platensis]WSI59256.1 condensation domain-containing protein [Streptomyces platensis]